MKIIIRAVLASTKDDQAEAVVKKEFGTEMNRTLRLAPGRGGIRPLFPSHEFEANIEDPDQAAHFIRRIDPLIDEVIARYQPG